MKTLLTTLLLCVSALSVIPAQTPHPLGWKPSPHGIKGAPIDTHPKFKAAPLHQAASLEEAFRNTNQKRRGACVAFSTWESYDAVHFLRFGKHVDLSALDIYQQCLVADGNFPQDDGTFGGTAIKVMQKNGSLMEKTWPYDNALEVLPKLTSAMKGERTKHKALKAYTIPNNDGGYSIRQCIDNIKIPAMIGTYWLSNSSTARQADCKTLDSQGNAVTVKRYVLPYPSGRVVGGHEIPIGAYDDNMRFPDGNVGGCWIHNHWDEDGQLWADARGGAWIPYKWAFNPKLVEDVVAIEIVKK